MSEALKKAKAILSQELPEDQVQSLITELMISSGKGSVVIEEDAKAVIVTGRHNIVGNNNRIVINQGADSEELIELVEKLRSFLRTIQQHTQANSDDLSKKNIQPRLADSTQKPVFSSFSDLLPSVGQWQGRETELKEIKQALQQTSISLICITGIGGIGKSTLAARLYEDADEFIGKFWADVVKQSQDFMDFSARLIAQDKGESLDDAKRNNSQDLRLDHLVKLLQDKPYLIIVDNLEVILKPDENIKDDNWKKFLNQWIECGDRSKLLITSRERPNLPGTRTYWYEINKGISQNAGVKLLRSLGIHGSEEELQSFVNSVDGHPLALMLAAGFLKEEEEKDPQIAYLKNYGAVLELKGLHRGQIKISLEDIFNQSFERLSTKLQRLLVEASIFKGDLFTYSQILTISTQENISEQDLRQLARRCLLQELGRRNEEEERQFQLQMQVLNFLERKPKDNVEQFALEKLEESKEELTRGQERVLGSAALTPTLEQARIIKKFEKELKSGKEAARWLDDKLEYLSNAATAYAVAWSPKIERATSLQKLDDFCFTIKQFLERISHCLTWGRSNILDSTDIPLVFDTDVYIIVFDFIKENMAKSLTGDSKNQMEEYIDYLIQRFPSY